MNLDSTEVAELKAKQFEQCPAEQKVSIIITGFQEDARAKATFFNIEAARLTADGSERKADGRFRYSQLLEFNESLIQDYGAIRILRLFPPKKFVGNKEGSFVQQRKDALQTWLNELVADEETCADPKLLTFFQIAD
jgi:hypothetical protein